MQAFFVECDRSPRPAHASIRSFCGVRFVAFLKRLSLRKTTELFFLILVSCVGSGELRSKLPKWLLRRVDSN